jgi:hypothetical protein
MKETKQKIFCIGLNKTGTTTLGSILEKQGYKVKGFDGEVLIKYRFRGFDASIQALIEEYDAFQDIPWPLMFEELYTNYPGAKFILTTRSSADKWFKSIKKHSLTTSPFFFSRKWTYGYHYPRFHRQAYVEQYSAHNERVRQFFKNKPDIFIEICWEKEHQEEILRAFLNLESIPDIPRSNPISTRIANTAPIIIRLNKVFSLIGFFERRRRKYSISLFRRVVNRIIQPLLQN